MARQACSHAQVIPKKILITDDSQLPDVYSTTPGGTLFSTTPGGTKIVYERSFLIGLRNSPLSRTPPKNIPIGLQRGQPNIPINGTTKTQQTHPQKRLSTSPKQVSHDDQFEMDL